jgi:hypothetical protein
MKWFDKYLGWPFIKRLDTRVTQLESQPAPSLPYKIYSATLTQTGTDDPVANVLQNTLGPIVWTRQSPGTYRIDYIQCAALGITQSKGMILIGNAGSIRLYAAYIFDDGDGDVVELAVKFFNTMPPTNADGFYNLSIEIRVYP